MNTVTCGAVSSLRKMRPEEQNLKDNQKPLHLGPGSACGRGFPPQEVGIIHRIILPGSTLGLPSIMTMELRA
jgi:hypothetical protein